MMIERGIKEVLMSGMAPSTVSLFHLGFSWILLPDTCYEVLTPLLKLH